MSYNLELLTHVDCENKKQSFKKKKMHITNGLWRIPQTFPLLLSLYSSEGFTTEMCAHLRYQDLTRKQSKVTVNAGLSPHRLSYGNETLS